ncbi:MAG TPA: MBL fold metallo-hydrolase [Thermoanaerobaculia bacterium]|nr:MBL fold metallo-hydrolase [Thermoanaerobaculia bacterium]HXK66915.1 MBL fold metallo-hydrolase [Thermoanaerobaculia bacterium]
MYELSFLGACGTVTGSKYHFKVRKTEWLIDCGVFQGTQEIKQMNWQELPFDPEKLDAIILTHAHIDHSGFVPRMVKMGYSGPVYCTRGTAALLQILWPDAGSLQEEEAHYANKRQYTPHKPALPLFTEKDAKRALSLLRPTHYGHKIELNPGIDFIFERVGHILGASFIQLRIKRSRDEHHHWIFSGDVGRPTHPILKPPVTFPGADYLVVESTYGKRLHGMEDPAEILGDVVNETIRRGGVVLIPAFAVGRSQEILYYLRSLKLDGRIPEDLPIYIDSPMSVEALQLTRQFHREHNIELRMLEGEGVEFLSGPHIHPIQRVSDSKSLNHIKGRAVILSASGMCNGGRIEHHLKHKLPDPRNTILFVGYQAHGTKGRRILEGEEAITIHGDEIPVKAQVRVINSISAHADADELLHWLNHDHFREPDVFVVHGEDEQREGFSDLLKSRFGWRATIPTLGQRFRFP